MPSARGTRQSLKNPRQRVCRVSTLDKRHSVNFSRQTYFAECFLSDTRQRFRRVSEKHSAKIYTRQNKNTKKPKNNSKKTQIFFSGEATTGQRAPASIEVAAFFALNSRQTPPVGFELMTSTSRVYCSTTALHCHLCLDSVIYPHILY